MRSVAPWMLFCIMIRNFGNEYMSEEIYQVKNVPLPVKQLSNDHMELMWSAQLLNSSST